MEGHFDERRVYKYSSCTRYCNNRWINLNIEVAILTQP